MVATIGARLKHDGTLLTTGEFDGTAQSTHSITKDFIFADDFDETTLSDAAASGGSLHFNGLNQKLEITGTGDFQFGTGDFTIEGWFYVEKTSGSVPYTRLWCFPDGDNIEVHGSQLYYWNGGGSVISSGSNTFQPYTWFHVALVKASGVATVYVNGISKITDNSPYNSTNSRALAIGGEVDTSIFGESATSGTTDGWLKGNMTNFRVVKGTAVYTSDFSIAYAPLSAVSGTKLLLEVADSATKIADTSGTSKSVVASGGIAYQAETPLATANNGAMKQLKNGTLQVANEFDEYNGGSASLA